MRNCSVLPLFLYYNRFHFIERLTAAKNTGQDKPMLFPFNGRSLWFIIRPMKEDYRKAKRNGEKAVHKAISRGRYPYLPALDYLLQSRHLRGEEYVGLQELPLSMIAGTRTSGRQNAFACNFMPVLDPESEFASKWSNLYDIQIKEGFREPVKVYEFMRRFYVLEGNKRVSVLKYLGTPTVLADVTRLLPAYSDDPETLQYYEFLQFYRAVPLYEVEIAARGGYARLAACFGKDLSAPWTEEDVQRLKSIYRFFAGVYAAHGGAHLDLPAGDALLVYLNLFPDEPLEDLPAAVLSERIGTIWQELLIGKTQDNIALISDPEKEGTGGLLSALKQKMPFTEKKPLTIAFLYDQSPATSSWAYAHELGRLHLENTAGGLVRTLKKEDCGHDALLAEELEECLSEGADILLTTSQIQMNTTVRSAIRHPEARFMNCSVNLPHSAVSTYYSRMYEAKFLLGALAGIYADNHRVGYRADYPLYGSIAGINAFALGVSMTDPLATVHLAWATREGFHWQAELLEKDIHVFSGLDMIRPEAASREYGLFIKKDGQPVRNLAAPLWDWGRYYTLLFGDLLHGFRKPPAQRADKAVNYWYGMSSGVVDVILSKDLPTGCVRLIEALRAGILSDRVSPFSGELHSQEGVIKTADSAPLSGHEVITMNWLNENIEGSLPDPDELTPKAKAFVEASGVTKP